ncbi:helix-turn-helix domain-containing protein [Cellulomonas biazotea]|uniref:Transcriptional regulator n=1 Tax=Cellulomonas biazotea TaxID=1709 RepID=A0A402DPM8_9CELL|nr:helix-turn-helix transcriptional regulator [Cellulomonas biazotea]GCE76058.1 transcriptional regulator [Cellulomonas biazotea]
MAKRTYAYLPATLAAVETLGVQVAIARRQLGWTVAELAGRLGVSTAVVGRIEKGAPGTAVGTVLEAAVLCGVPLFGADARDLPDLAARQRATLALLPERVRPKPAEIDDDF